MFTGIVEEIGTIERLEEQADAMRLTVRGPSVVRDAREGDSIAVDGCCLTVATVEGETFTADVMAESLRRTTLGALAEDSTVNLESAATPTTRLGGHLVQGHVDGTGTVVARTPSEHWEVIEIELPDGLAKYVVEKGSIAVDGISLTVVGVSTSSTAESTFTVSLIPETLERTTLGSKQPGSRVNLEVDVVAKYVERLLGERATTHEAPASAGLGWPATPASKEHR
jgi:riboflavin synthase